VYNGKGKSYPVGLLVGLTDVGAIEGCADGESVGTKLGMFVGLGGVNDGPPVGGPVLTIVGSLEGVPEGTSDGVVLGDAEGVKVGALEGFFV